MQLLLKGIEERKNEELSKYREEVEQEIRIESERYIKRLVCRLHVSVSLHLALKQERISELEDKVRFYESIDADSARLHTSVHQKASDAMEASMQSSSMQESCMVVDQRGGGSSQGDDQPGGTFSDGDGDERVDDANAPERPSSDHST